MSHNPLHNVLHGLAHAAKHERHEGHPERANALCLIGVGVLFLPIPFIGLPMIGYGIYKAFTAGPN